MKNIIMSLIIILSLAQYTNAQMGSDVVRNYLKLDNSKEINEHTLKEAMLKISPIGTKFKDVVNKLEAKGIYYNPKDNSPTLCFPADNTPLYCQFKSTKEDRGTEPDYTVDFIFDKDNKVEDIVVVRSYSGRVKRYTTSPTQPAKNITLRNNLSVISKIKEFDLAYGKGQIEEGSSVPDDWPLSILYFDDKTKEYFYVGVDIGNMSWNDLKKLKQNRKQLSEYKAGIIYVVNGNK